MTKEPIMENENQNDGWICPLEIEHEREELREEFKDVVSRMLDFAIKIARPCSAPCLDKLRGHLIAVIDGRASELSLDEVIHDTANIFDLDLGRGPLPLSPQARAMLEAVLAAA
jgi:hypothetical protein